MCVGVGGGEFAALHEENSTHFDSFQKFTVNEVNFISNTDENYVTKNCVRL